MMAHSIQAQGAAVARLVAGEPLKRVAREMQIPPSTLRRWRDSSGLVPLRPDAEVQREFHEEIGQLLIAYTREAILTLTEMARFLRTESWLRAQSADDVGVAYGVHADKTFRLLAAIRPIDIPEQSPSIGGVQRPEVSGGE